MPDQIGPARARERLRSRLKDLREQSGLTSESVLEQTRWSTSKLTRIESGYVTIQAVEVEALLRLYGVEDRDEVADLKNLAVMSRRREWWNSAVDPGEYRDFIAYEDEASRVTSFQALFLPGLLQTEQYAKAITSVTIRKPPDSDEVAKRVTTRLRRQREFFARMDGTSPPQLRALIDGAVLERPVGGAQVMRGQLDRLLEVAKRPQVQLVVMPLQLGGYAGLGGVFELLEFSGSGDPDVVFVESTAKDFLIKDEETTKGYRDVADAIVAAGVTGDDALKEIRRIRESL